MIGIINAELLRRMADSLILPFNLNTYAKEIQKEYDLFEAEYKNDLDALNISLLRLKSSISNFTRVAADFHKRLESIDKTKIHLIRIFNDQLRNVERAFLDTPSGLQRNGYQ